MPRYANKRKPPESSLKDQAADELLFNRKSGNRNSETNSGALAAASAVEAALNAIRRQTALGVNIADGHSLIERLQTDPSASL